MSYQAPDANQQYNQYPDPGQQGSNPPRAPSNNPYGPQAGYGQPYGPPPGYQYQQPGQGQPYGPPPRYGQPYGQQPGYGQQPYHQPTTLGGLAVTNLPQNVVAALSYAFLWVGALLCLSYAGRNHFLPFPWRAVHALFRQPHGPPPGPRFCLLQYLRSRPGCCAAHRLGRGHTGRRRRLVRARHHGLPGQVLQAAYHRQPGSALRR